MNLTGPLKLFGALAILGAAMSGAQAGEGGTLKAECLKQLGLSESGCTCIGNKAEAELSETQQQLVVAHVTKNKAKAAEIQATMSPEDMTAAATFMTTAPGACANQ